MGFTIGRGLRSRGVELRSTARGLGLCRLGLGLRA